MYTESGHLSSPLSLPSCFQAIGVFLLAPKLASQWPLAFFLTLLFSLILFSSPYCTWRDPVKHKYLGWHPRSLSWPYMTQRPLSTPVPTSPIHSSLTIPLFLKSFTVFSPGFCACHSLLCLFIWFFLPDTHLAHVLGPIQVFHQLPLSQIPDLKDPPRHSLLIYSALLFFTT